MIAVQKLAHSFLAASEFGEAKTCFLEFLIMNERLSCGDFVSEEEVWDKMDSEPRKFCEGCIEIHHQVCDEGFDQIGYANVSSHLDGNQQMMVSLKQQSGTISLV